MGHGDVCLLTEAEGRPYQGEDRLPVIKLTVPLQQCLLSLVNPSGSTIGGGWVVSDA